MRLIPTRSISAMIGLLVAWGFQAAAAPAKETGTIVGVVRFTGKVPPPEKIKTTDGGVLEHNDLVVDPKNRGLRFVTAVLENAPAQPPVKKAEPVFMDQRDMVFLPRVIAAQHGQTVRFDNNDLCNHSVQAFSTLKANSFNWFTNANQSFEYVFEPQKHPVMIGCSLHAWMRAWVLVVPHPWFAVSDAKGEFRIEAVPPGTYTLWLRHPDTGKQERRELNICAGQETRLTVEWDRTENK